MIRVLWSEVLIPHVYMHVCVQEMIYHLLGTVNYGKAILRLRDTNNKTKYILYSRPIIKFSVLWREVNSGNWTLVTNIYTLNSAEPKWCAVSYIYFSIVSMPRFLSHLKRAIQYLFRKWIMPYFYLFHIYTKLFSCSLAWVFRRWS